MLRLKDIAARAGVSVMTVSKALRDAPDISAATKARVKSLALQMGYVLDTTAQSLRTRTTRYLGIVIPSVTEPIYARIVLAIEERAHEHGYDIILAHTHNLEEREQTCLQRLLMRRVDGLFIAPVYRLRPEAPVYDALKARNLPVVILGHTSPFCRNFTNVETDDNGASYLMTRHLLELGHKNIAFFAGPSAAPWASERLEGHRRALREAGRDLDDRLVFQAGYTIEDGAKAALQFVNDSTNATAIQAVNDHVAIGCANTFLNQGIKIPQQLSVAGFGNFLVSEHFRVPLTTVRQPKFRLGSEAMDSMLKLLRQERCENKRLRAEIIVRQSTSSPLADQSQPATGTPEG